MFKSASLYLQRTARLSAGMYQIDGYKIKNGSKRKKEKTKIISTIKHHGVNLNINCCVDIAKLDLGEILALTPLRFEKISKGTAIKRLKLEGLLRNACIVAANRGAADLLPTLQQLAEHASPIVRAHAVWAVQRLAGAASAQTRLEVARSRETDALVLAEYDQGAPALKPRVKRRV